MSPTRISVLVGVGIVAIPAGWTLATLFDVLTGGLPGIPWATPALLAVLVVALFVAAQMVKGWVRERRFHRQLDPLRIARLVVLAKASAVLGVVVAGGYAGFGLRALRFAETAFGRQRLLITALTVVAGFLVTVVALRLERACRVPPREDEQSGPSDSKLG